MSSRNPQAACLVSPGRRRSAGRTPLAAIAWAATLGAAGLALAQPAPDGAAVPSEPAEAPPAAPAAPSPAAPAAPPPAAPAAPPPAAAEPPSAPAPPPPAQPDPPAAAPEPYAQSLAEVPQLEPEPEPAEATEQEAEPAAPALKVGVGLRTGLAFASEDPGETTFSLHDGLIDQVHIRPYFSGQLNEHVGLVANFEVGTPNGLGSFNVLDAIVQLRVVDEFQVWVGQHIAANDRNSMNGPFYANSWNFPITVATYPFDVAARDRGVTFWGLVAGGRLKYHLSVVDLQPGRKLENARFGGRVVVHLLEPENFYYNSGTNYGAADMLALGAVINYQKGVDVPAGMPDDNDFLGFSFDAIFEKTLANAGTFTLEGGYWNFEEVGLDYVVNQGTVDEGMGVAYGKGSSYMLLVSWLTPDKVGAGFIQPNARVQIGDFEDIDGQIVTFDAGLAYVVDGFNHRWHLNYRHEENPNGPGDADDASIDMVQVGAQLQL